MTVSFPSNYLLRSIKFSLVGRGQTGGVALSGEATRVAANSAHWVASVRFMLKDDAQFLAWQAFVSNMGGVVGETLVPAWSRVMPKDGQGRDVSRQDFVKIGKVTVAQTQIEHAALSSFATNRDTRVRVSYSDTMGIFAGHRIGIGEGFYEVLASYSAGNDNYFLQIFPPLRGGKLNGTPVIIDRPVCRMRFDDGDAGQPGFDLSDVEFIDVKFREAYA